MFTWQSHFMFIKCTPQNIVWGQFKGRINVYGNNLFATMYNNYLYIANGTFGNTKNKGKVTIKQTSLINYLIVSEDLSPYILNWKWLCLIRYFLVFIKDYIPIPQRCYRINCLIHTIRRLCIVSISYIGDERINLLTALKENWSLITCRTN